MNRRPSIRVAVALAVILWLRGLNPAAAADPGARATGTPLARYLETFALDREAREILDPGHEWGDDQTALVIRVLLRIMLAPPEFLEAWRDEALPPAALATPPEDRFVHLRGSAVFVAEVMLPEAVTTPTGRRSIDLVRIRTAEGEFIDVVTDAAPRAWRRSHDLDEPAEVFGLPVAAAIGPIPAPPPDGAPWPSAPPARLRVAARVAWHPAKLPGSAGMDMGLLDAVVDGQKLTGAESDAFYALLAAAGRAGEGAIASAAGPPAPLIRLIDPAEQWFQHHRGAPIAVDGLALRATRIEIDDPLRQRETGIDHYWEVFVFVNTPLISVGGKAQDRYPVVCCLRSLPPGMPTGPTISAPVRVAGFALKSYAYPLPKGDGTELRREAPLLIGADLEWRRQAAPAAGGVMSSVLVGLAAVVVAGVALALWAGRRDARKRAQNRRAALPDRFTPPGAA